MTGRIELRQTENRVDLRARLAMLGQLDQERPHLRVTELSQG